MTCEPCHSKRPGAYIGGIATARKRGCGYKLSIGNHRSSACPPHTCQLLHNKTVTLYGCWAKEALISDCPLQQMHRSITQDMMSPIPKGAFLQNTTPRATDTPNACASQHAAMVHVDHPFQNVRTQVPSDCVCWHCYEGQSSPGATVSTLCTLHREQICHMLSAPNQLPAPTNTRKTRGSVMTWVDQPIQHTSEWWKRRPPACLESSTECEGPIPEQL
jgi:hypothetical protein